jgi:hypothetical protein
VDRVLLYLYTNDYDTKPPLADGLPISCERESTAHSNASTSHVSATDSINQNATKATATQPTGELSDTFSGNVKAEIHALVYACADKLGIANLKQAACQKFMAALTIEELTAPTFTSTLSTVYDSTAATDDVLRPAVAKRLFKEMTILRNVPEITEMLRRYEPVAWAVFETFEETLAKRAKKYKSCKESLQSTELKYLATLEENKTLLGRLKAFETSVVKKDQHIESLKKFIDSYKKPFSSQCGTQLSNTVVRRINEPMKQLYLECLQCHHLQKI